MNYAPYIHYYICITSMNSVSMLTSTDYGTDYGTRVDYIKIENSPSKFPVILKDS